MKPIYGICSFLMATALFTACTSNEIGESKDVAQDKIYQGYSVSYTEGDATVEVYSQFRFAGRNGTTLVLSNPSRLQLDGEAIKVDSGDYSGAYYKAAKPAAGFYGTHQLVFTTTDNKNYSNRFSFDAFKLVNVPATTSKKTDLLLPFDAPPLQGDDYISVQTVGSDSSFDISHNYADGKAVKIPAEYLKKQTGKTVTLQASITRKIPLQQSTGEGGSLQINYKLKPVQVGLTD